MVSGATVVGPYDPPAATDLSPSPLHIHALKKINPAWSSGSGVPPVVFVNEDKFQVWHCGIDDAWGADALDLTSVHGVDEAGRDVTLPADYLLYPTGPFTLDAADTLVNFSDRTLEGSQP